MLLGYYPVQTSTLNGKPIILYVIKGCMRDYVINIYSKKVVRGSRFRLDTFTEIWTFEYESGLWKLREIS